MPDDSCNATNPVRQQSLQIIDVCHPELDEEIIFACEGVGLLDLFDLSYLLDQPAHAFVLRRNPLLELNDSFSQGASGRCDSFGSGVSRGVKLSG
jgi:hypothetical protein